MEHVQLHVDSDWTGVSLARGASVASLPEAVEVGSFASESATTVRVVSASVALCPFTAVVDAMSVVGLPYSVVAAPSVVVVTSLPVLGLNSVVVCVVVSGFSSVDWWVVGDASVVVCVVGPCVVTCLTVVSTESVEDTHNRT